MQNIYPLLANIQVIAFVVTVAAGAKAFYQLRKDAKQ